MAKINNNENERSIKEIEILFKLLADELLLMLNTKNALQQTVKGRHSKKKFLQSQHKELKEMIGKIAEYITSHKRKMTDTRNLIKILLSEHENVISYYRENSSRITGESYQETKHFINSLLEKHAEMAWALRVQLK